MSLRWRLTAVIGGVVALMVTFASVLAYLSADRELSHQVDSFLLERSREAEQAIPDLVGGAIPGQSTLNEVFAAGQSLGALNRPDVATQLVLPDTQDGSQVVAKITEPTIEPEVEDVVIANRPTDQPIVRRFTDRDVNGENYRVLTSSGRYGALMIGHPTSQEDNTLEGLRKWLIAISGTGSLAAAVMGWFVADRVLRPVSRLAAATQQVAETRQFDAELRVEGDDELGGLASNFNSMLSALRASREQQYRLVRDANHELRTPLTSLRTNVDVLKRQREHLHADEASAIISEMDAEVGELTSLVSELVDSATDSSSLTEDNFENVDLAELAWRVAERTRKRTGRSVSVKADGTTEVGGDIPGLERALGNLLGNAVKFSPIDSPITVVVDGNCIEVLDRGPGISAQDEDRIFDRFYRSDRTRTMPGSGLGLAIVADVARAHQGSVFARNRSDGGAAIGFSVLTEATELPPAADPPLLPRP